MGEYRTMIEQTLYNLRYDMDRIGAEAEIWEELHSMTDAELITVFNDFVEEVES